MRRAGLTESLVSTASPHQSWLLHGPQIESQGVEGAVKCSSGWCFLRGRQIESGSFLPSQGLQKRAWILDVDCYWFQSGLPLTCWATLGNVLKLSSLSFTICKMRKIKVTSIIM